MSRENDVILGSLKLVGIIDEEFFESAQDLLQRIPELYGVEVPASVSNVIISVSQPGDDQRDSFWIRRDNASNLVGFYVYAVGKWRLIYPVPTQVFLIAGGDSRTPPDGFILASDSTKLTQAVKDHLKTMWHWNNGAVNTFYDVFHVVYNGF